MLGKVALNLLRIKENTKTTQGAKGYVLNR
jgi:hypothetical protein